ncbi:acyltransferase [Janibacter sp. UYMM211]|uniref:acyltransferase family protein n=1 Tax=Janibacter sp. UYMM211 TaxID=3156342 RepID=UPI003392A5DA
MSGPRSPRRYRSAYGHTPALDGFRGLFMALFLVGHFGLPHADGLWLAINTFFVLSGFFITRLLVEERAVTGRVDAWRFYQRRARRLLPGLLLVVSAITVWALALAPAGQARRIGGDVLATLGFAMNWRLVVQGDQYFGDQANPSPLRHAWTLAIEEQYYLLIPLVLLLLMTVLRSRKRLGIAFAVLSLVASVHLVVVASSGASFPRLYYSTDTRVSALLMGSALGAFFSAGRDGVVPRVPRRWVSPLAWVGVLSLVAAFFSIGPYSSWVWERGGMLLANLGTVAIIIGIADPARPRAIAAVFEWRPVREVGRLTYSLYLWHWPVHVALLASPIGDQVLLSAVVGLSLTALLAHLSDRYVEAPVLRGGVRALLPRTRRPVLLTVAAVAVPALVVGATLMRAPTQEALAAEPTTMDAAPQVVQGQPEYVPGSPTRIGMVGDSVPWYLVERFPERLFPDAQPVNLAHEGCDLLDAPLVNAFETKATTPQCQEAKDSWPRRAKEAGVEAVAVWGSTLLSLPHEQPDGTVVRLGDPGHTQMVFSQLDRMHERAGEAGIRDFYVVTVTCRSFPKGPGNDEFDAIREATPEYLDEYSDPVRTNALLRDWVEAHPDTRLLDLHGAVCADGYTEEVQGLPLYDDAVHFSPEASPMIWRWLLGQVSQAWRTRG